MKAYPKGNKDMYLARVRAHRAADELARGIGWETNGQTRGCAVGCTLHSYNHALYPELLGVPIQLAYLEDWLFENLPSGHLDWPEQFLDAIQPGADLTGVWPAWVRRMLTRRLVALGEGTESWRCQVREALEGVMRLYASGMPDSRAAIIAAWATAEDAAWATAEASRAASRAATWAVRAAIDAAWADARAAAEASWAAVRPTAAYAAAAAARAAIEINLMAEDLLDLLRFAPREE